MAKNSKKEYIYQKYDDFEKKANSRKTLKYLAPTWWNQLPLRVTTYTQTFRGVHLPKMTKKHFKVGKKSHQILRFWTPWDVWWRYSQTLWATCLKFCMQVSICQGHIHAKFQLSNQTTTMNFSLNKPKKRVKNGQIWVFWL